MEEYWVDVTMTQSAQAEEPLTATFLTPSTHTRRNCRSNFDEHRRTLEASQVDDGWRAELRRYLGTFFKVDKDVDVVEWWQVSQFSYIFSIIGLTAVRTMPKNFQHLLRLPSISSLFLHHPCLANSFFLLGNSLLWTNVLA